MYLSLTKTKFQKRGGWDMKKSWLSGVLMLLAVLPAAAQQVMYSNLKELVENRGDTVTTLKIEKRTKNQIYLMDVICCKSLCTDWKIRCIKLAG